MTAAVVRGVVSAVVSGVVSSAPAGGPVEHVQNGDFSSATGWTLGAGWTIAAGVATGVSTTDPLENALSSSIGNGEVVTWALTITTNTGGEMAANIFNDDYSSSFELFSGETGTGTLGGSVAAGSGGPYTKLIVIDNVGGTLVVIDNVSATTVG